MLTWDLPVPLQEEIENQDIAPPVSINAQPFARADRDSARPFATECLSGAIPTYRGIKHNWSKPDGRYRFVDHECVRRILQKKAQKFEAMVWANTAVEEVFDSMFSSEEYPAHSGVRTINTKSMEGVGT